MWTHIRMVALAFSSDLRSLDIVRNQAGNSDGHQGYEMWRVLPVSAVLLRLRTFKMSLVIFLMVCRASSLSLPTPYKTTNRWLHSWLLLSSWSNKRSNKGDTRWVDETNQLRKPALLNTIHILTTDLWPKWDCNQQSPMIILWLKYILVLRE